VNSVICISGLYNHVCRFPEVDKLSPPILQLSEISFGYGKQVVFKNMNINADMESRIALVGENGTGKTTLVKLLTGELSPREGYRQAHRSLKTAFFSQHHVDQLVMDVTPLEFMQQKFPGKREEEYRHALGMFGVSSDLALRPIASLSGGQKSRLAFAIMAVPRLVHAQNHHKTSLKRRKTFHIIAPIHL
jgi:ATP-binding cassette subfamily F protein 3